MWRLPLGVGLSTLELFLRIRRCTALKYISGASFFRFLPDQEALELDGEELEDDLVDELLVVEELLLDEEPLESVFAPCL